MGSDAVGAVLGNGGEYMGSPEQPKPDIKYHDRLDLLLHVDDYLDQPCGSEGRDGKKYYCCNDCPTLKSNILSSDTLKTSTSNSDK